MGKNAQMSLYPEWVCGLLHADAFPHPVGGLQLVETHISWVILSGEFAYKIKKPVDLGFVDFSTLQLRKFFCEEELRLNRRTTPDLYLDVVPIGLLNGKPVIGQQPAFEYAVRMHQFPADARFDHKLAAGQIKTGQIEELAELLATFHSRLPQISGIAPSEAASRASQPALDNFNHLEGQHISLESRRQIDTIQTWTLEQVSRLGPVFRQRASDGHIHECHGDLHLANLFVRNGRVYPYDSLEFNPDLRCIDQICDISFLIMDLMAQDKMDLAFIFLNSWLEKTGDYDGLSVLRFYLVYRCMVRLKVASIQAHQLNEHSRGEHAIQARQYLGLAQTLIETLDHPAMVLMHGLSGSGKTWASSKLITAMPAIRVRSDLERKRLYGFERHQHSGAAPMTGHYSETATRQTYETLARHCETGLQAGLNIVADATFLKRAQRQLFFDLSSRLKAKFIIVECKAPLKTLRERISQRLTQGTDESDADLAVLEHQIAHAEPLDDEERNLTVQDIGELGNE